MIDPIELEKARATAAVIRELHEHADEMLAAGDHTGADALLREIKSLAEQAREEIQAAVTRVEHVEINQRNQLIGDWFRSLLS